MAAPRRDAIDDAIFFHDQLVARGMPFGGAVVNRFHDSRGNEKVDLSALDPELAEKVQENFADYKVLATRDRTNLRRLTKRLSGEPVIVVPELDGDVHDLDGLEEMVEHLYG